jgi:Cu(I)/Ag(I) efflux system membrane protein CusA/SilA
MKWGGSYKSRLEQHFHPADHQSIEMLSTGVRTDIGVKVFGPDLDTIDRVCKDIEAVLKPIKGSRDVIASPIMGKGYLQVDINRLAAARYGISIEDVQNEIEVALAGRAVTFTVEKRERFPVRIRYARVNREDEESIRRLLISPSNMAPSTAMNSGSMNNASAPAMSGQAESNDAPRTHSAVPAHAAQRSSLIPLSRLPTCVWSKASDDEERERAIIELFVTLNVRGRDIVGYVDEAQRVVAQKVKLPEGVHIEWSGEIEHQVRAARTLRYVFPAVIILIFVILYLPYNDLADAALMMLAVPEALAGGAFFMFLFLNHELDAMVSVAVVGFIGFGKPASSCLSTCDRQARRPGGLIKSLRGNKPYDGLQPKLLTEG